MAKQKFYVGNVVRPVKGRVGKRWMYLFPNGKGTITWLWRDGDRFKYDVGENGDASFRSNELILVKRGINK